MADGGVKVASTVLIGLALASASGMGAETSAKEPVPETPRMGREIACFRERVDAERRKGRRLLRRSVVEERLSGSGDNGRVKPMRASVFQNAFETAVNARM